MLFPVHMVPPHPYPAPSAHTLGVPGPEGHHVPEASSPLSDSPPSLEWVLCSVPWAHDGEGIFRLLLAPASYPAAWAGPLRGLEQGQAAPQFLHRHTGTGLSDLWKPARAEPPGPESCSHFTGLTLKGPLPTSIPPSSNKSTLVFRGSPPSCPAGMLSSRPEPCNQHIPYRFGESTQPSSGGRGSGDLALPGPPLSRILSKGWKKEDRRQSMVLGSQSPWMGLRLGPYWTSPVGFFGFWLFRVFKFSPDSVYLFILSLFHFPDFFIHSLARL